VLAQLDDKQIMVGCIDLSDMNVETPQVIADRIRRALPYVAKESRLGAVHIHQFGEHAHGFEVDLVAWRANLTAPTQCDHPERLAFAKAIGHQVEVTRLEHLEAEQTTRKQHGLQRKQRQL
jgi:hypothetical protein